MPCPHHHGLMLALDQGTSSSRALLFNRDGAVVASGQCALKAHFPQPGWVEQDALEIWATQRAAIAEALARGRVDIKHVHAVGLTNQRETTLIWDRAHGEPLGPAIVWQDRRTATTCTELKAQGHETLIQTRTGLLLDPYFSATKIRWLLDTIPGAQQRAERGELAFGTVDTWLAWQLSAKRLHVTDPSNASRTLLFNLHTGDWDPNLLDLFNIPRALMPEIVASSGLIGTLNLEGHTLPLAGIAGDQQAALFGQGCLHAGMAKNTYGTGCFLLMNTGNHAPISRSGLLSTVAWRVSSAGPSTHLFALEGSVFHAGAVVQWLRDGLGLIRQTRDIEDLAASVPDNDGVYMVPAFTGLGAPWWDAQARGTIYGLTRGTQRAHLARAALESIAFQSADVLEAMQTDAPEPFTELRVDGGASANNLLMQCQADLLGVPVIRPRILETTALGAAQLAGLGSGFWDGPEALAQHWQPERTFEPQIDAETATQRRAGWHDAVRRACGNTPIETFTHP